MWARKRLDVGWSDLAFGIARSIVPPNRQAAAREVEGAFGPSAETLACLSVRSGFDLLLAALEFTPRSEVLLSAMNIGDMPKIIEGQGLIPIPVDLDVESFGPNLASLNRAITPRTRAMVVAHLCGGRVALEPILALAHERGILVFEDCAQAFDGGSFVGHPQADASMFSLGPIKTATALGGGVLRVRDRVLLSRLRARHAAWPVQSRWSYFCRLLKYSLLKLLSLRPMLSLIIAGCRAIGRDHDQFINGSVRGFAGPGFFDRIRRQPSAPLLSHGPPPAHVP